MKLLQLGHLDSQKHGGGDGFLTCTPAQFHNTYRGSYLTHPPELWNNFKALMNSNHPWSYWTYAYLTPGKISSIDGARQESGCLLLGPETQYALISTNNIVANGGTGKPIGIADCLKSLLPANLPVPRIPPKQDLTPSPARNSPPPPAKPQQAPPYPPICVHKNLPLPKNLRPPAPRQEQAPRQTPPPPPKKEFSLFDKPTLPPAQWTSDVRPWYKNVWNQVGDPVDTVTGAFYLDETDLALPGPFPLSIRRNYNSRNPLLGELGCGWKLSLNPFLIDQEGKRFAAELDGTVIVYSYNHQNHRWEVRPEDNPELSNFTQQGIENGPSPFHAYIEKDVLYGADGSKRFYQDGRLQKFVDVRGNVLFFSYKNDRLSRIESSNGDFCGIHYNHAGYISDIYAKDGRRISYTYDARGDLVKVTLPNTAVIQYIYDRHHRVIREVKPYGRVVENVYDDAGRVKEQRSPMGSSQEMITTATFEYAEGKTVVTDAAGGKTIYQIHDKQIYKITDPLGATILQAWFIHPHAWFDPVSEAIRPWNQPGGAIKSLKATTDKRGLTTSYLYDSQGNPQSITLEGKDLTGSGVSTVTKILAYNEKNLCIEEAVEGQKTQTTYDVQFPYLPKRIEKYSENTLTGYTDLTYNALGQLEREEYSGAVTLWKYNERGFPSERIQETGTDDPSVVTTYAYNAQGQCIEMKSADGMQKYDYDLMGNQVQSKSFSNSGELLFALSIGYDLNNTPIWKQTANLKNIVYFDYYASGLMKAQRRLLIPSDLMAYTLYTYNPCGYLTQEVDPRGYVTYRDYDLLGRVKTETKENHTAHFSYEAGGLIETVISPLGGKYTYRYTTNGLLKEEVYPDGIKQQTLYDLFGRPILETKNQIAWEIEYDDAHHRITKTHQVLKSSEISEFDPRGNLIRFTDRAGFTLEKTYDHLGRLKTETSPSGQQTRWNYLGDKVICTLPSGETKTTHYAGGEVAQIEVSDPNGALISRSTVRFDPETDMEEMIEGDQKTVTWLNALDRPVKTEKGDVISQREYDASGNCIRMIDGDRRITHQEFDGLGRLVQKQLPDGSLLKFGYDLDSNLAEYHLPNGMIWKATYDLMQRKTSEELFSANSSSGRWTFSYADGYLVSATDPMQRTHSYLYDPDGRLSEDVVEGCRRTYTYEPRGSLSAVEQFTEETGETTRVERRFDPDGNLSLEAIYLNEQLIQQTEQKWTAHHRSLQIGNHLRDHVYQNGQLVQVSTPHLEASYTYDLSSALSSKKTQQSSSLIDYGPSGYPVTMLTQLPEGSYQETMEWLPSGKLSSYTAPEMTQHYAYNERGYLKSTGSETYDFDFGSLGLGICTAAPGWTIPQDGLDRFGKVLSAIIENSTLSTEYNSIGEVITYGEKYLSWDPWGRLIKVTDPAFTWEASYDALGRRLQTRYTKSGEQPCVINSLYDPNEEFQEIGVEIEGTTFWKFYGPDGCCDAIHDDTGASVTLIHNALRQLTGVISSQGTQHSKALPSAYGPLEAPSAPSADLMGYAQSLSWHSKSQDPTGFIWMGDRYYDSRTGRFLSQDPISYPSCLDLYTYASGDPINNFDPDGRFASAVYEPVKNTVFNIVSYPRFQGALQVLGGCTEASVGAALAHTPCAGLGFALVAHGADECAAGGYTVLTGRYRSTITEQSLQNMGMSSETACLICSVPGMIKGPSGAVRNIARQSSRAVSQGTRVVKRSVDAVKPFKSFTKQNARENLAILTGKNPKDMHAHHGFPQARRRDFIERGINIDRPEYMAWCEKKSHLEDAYRYNQRWHEFFERNENPTKAQILEKGREIMRDFGIDPNF